MTMMATHALTSFLASAGFGILFYAPRSSIIHCGFVGMAGWLTYMVCSFRFDAIVSTLIASFVVTAISHAFSKIYRTPIIVYSISGVIPLVPGGLAYEAMRFFVLKEYPEALGTAAQAFLISGAIAVGLVCSEVIHQLFQRKAR
ncbi:threonine/serine exporter family protein [Paenibacillus turpanensis]|uniref:threonine/serine exporter family protein n=1 Tax=Paenibacillus turpanensis TaxID=2689078 RepID=UPI00140BFECF|nr:threonine/serine exporter family protein [Paenibacillus turpanensis]